MLQPNAEGDRIESAPACALRGPGAVALATWQGASLRQAHVAGSQHADGADHVRNSRSGTAVSIYINNIYLWYTSKALFTLFLSIVHLLHPN